MPTHPFHVVDVFAERKYAGNQLAVVRDAADLTDEEMLAIAREMHYSETTFIESEEPNDGGYDVRIFTQAQEIPFAGHPTLGTAAVLREVAADTDEIVLNLGVGQIPVSVHDEDGAEVLWMEQVDPEFGETLDHAIAAAVVGLEPDDLDHDFPVQVVSTGLPALLVPLASLEATERAAVDLGAYESHVVEGLGIENVFVFAPEAVREENDVHARMFSPAHNTPEDPATGSANGCLAGYLARERFFGDSTVEVRVEQGYEMDRPSLLYLRAEDHGDEIDVEVGGSVVSVAEGSLL